MPGKDDPPEKQLGEIEIDWQVTEVSITRHPKFSTLTASELLAIEAWRSLPAVAASQRQNFQYPDPSVPNPQLNIASHWKSLDGKVREAAQYIARGMDTWLAPVPVVRPRRLYVSRGKISTDIGKISQPPLTIFWLYVHLYGRHMETSRQARRLGAGNRMARVSVSRKRSL